VRDRFEGELMYPSRTFLALVVSGVVLALSLAGCASRQSAPPPTPPPMPPPAPAPPPTSVAPPSPPLPPTGADVGPVNLDAYCRHVGYDGARLLSNTAYGWVCATANRMAAANVTYACRWEYGLWAVGHYTDYTNPRSWRCWSLS
jgi:hypothetical protein